MDFKTYLAASASTLSTAAGDPVLAVATERAVSLVSGALRKRLPVLVCGNGGSMADALHIAGELAARFRMERRGLPVIALGANAATLTAWSNDYDYASAFSREAEAYGREGGVLLAISTSGNSRNVVAAAEKAKEVGMSVVALTGAGGGKLADLADVLLAAPSQDTPRVQEVHIALYHYICERVERACS